MIDRMLPHDPLWPRVGGWPAPVAKRRVDLALVGVPTSRTSLSPTNAHETPAAIRAALSASGNSVPRAARLLQISDRALQMELAKRSEAPIEVRAEEA